MTPRALLFLGVCGHLCLLPVAVRHQFFWGQGEVFGLPRPEVLNALEAAGLVASTVLAGHSYLGAARRAGQLDERWLFGGACLLALAAFLVPPFLSSDVFDYVGRGRVESIHGGNPYVDTLSQYPADPALEWAQWPEFVMPYGPLTQLVQTAISWLAGDSVWVAVYGFKLLFAGAHLLAGWLVFRALAPRGAEVARRGMQLYLWNPLLLLEIAGSGHNEGLVAAGLAAMCWAIAVRRIALATVAFGLAMLCKHGCAPLGPCLLALAWRRRQLASFGGGVAIVAVLTTLLAAHYFADPGALEFLSRQTLNRITSLQRFADQLVPAGGDFVQFTGYAAVLAFLGWAAPRIRDLSSFGNLGAATMLLFLLLTMPAFGPWYHVWWLPLVAAWSRPALDRVLMAVALTGPLSYCVFLANRSLSLDHQITQWCVGLAVPVAYGVWYRQRCR